ncbi:SRPBCC family protein, partial [Mycobacterium asiaticum]|uniref:SRPBCC family protein n=1 Tax=Mycobacterium asiaticum TaxID=1790 RepID=UPI000A662FF6
MGINYSSVIDAPRDEVFAWYARPGAFNRLSPPWSPMRLIAEAESLEDGRAILALPGGLRWIAQHQPHSYDPPRRFADAISSDGLASLPPRLVARWRHTHDFEEISANKTRVIDRVETPVPASALRAMFAYRHRQLADDFAAHQADDAMATRAQEGGQRGADESRRTRHRHRGWPQTVPVCAGVRGEIIGQLTVPVGEHGAQRRCRHR